MDGGGGDKGRKKEGRCRGVGWKNGDRGNDVWGNRLICGGVKKPRHLSYRLSVKELDMSFILSPK